jgi:hypothetical protein
MAVGVVLEFSGATLDQYDQVLEKMGLERGGQIPNGGLFHWATATDDGFLVTDVWESREQFDAFSEAQIGPFSQEVGITSPPRVTFHEVHNYLHR